MDRRRFILGSAALGCSAAASPFLTPVALASGPWDNRLVVIVLRGAMDGLDAVRPLGDPDYAGLRPTLNDGKGLAVDDYWALNPALSPLLPLWQAGEMGAVHAVSTPYRDGRSHFDGQDVLEAGSLRLDGDAGGWLNRMVATVPGMTAETAYAIGQDRMAIMTGPAPHLRWSPEVTLEMSPQMRRLLETTLHGDPLFRDAALQAVAIADGMAVDDDGMATGNAASATALAEFTAARLREETRIASFSINGWDTHAGQAGNLSRAIGQLAQTILTLRDGLGPVWDRTAVLCMTEFGRTARENGTRGTDHGTGGALIYAGGALRGGQVAGRWPGLSEAALYDRRDLMPTGDVRAVAGWIMRGLFGLDADVIAQSVFPGLDLGTDPGLIL
ncbi:Uncharacterized conserved protein, DUF1501 family [Loktanella fryxellensis]|uniref:Uncharacterized conserved protein, DUF1501 family n=1 Tax=Loktanella fryxellensis TaxID=245187 RepID=A0A1H8ESE7_9RHOB|nr:DUF1501 domain-containing protein [Loktanella fryxellensis]SEN22415.1 Uncharacterized conserved protein, DUF1501 family [Loktanella fryxellensis]